MPNEIVFQMFSHIYVYAYVCVSTHTHTHTFMPTDHSQMRKTFCFSSLQNQMILCQINVVQLCCYRGRLRNEAMIHGKGLKYSLKI